MIKLLEKPSIHAILRAMILCLMGIAAFAFPNFLSSGMVYVIAGYLILNCALRVVEFFVRKRECVTSTNYVNLIFACLLMVIGLLAIGYYRYVMGLLPVFLGVIMIVVSVAYCAAAVGRKTVIKPLLIVLAVFIAIGGAVLVLWTFAEALGFRPLTTLAQIFGFLTLLSAIYEFAVYVNHRKAMQQ